MTLLLEAREQFYGLAAISASAAYLRDNGLDDRSVEACAGVLGLARTELLPGRLFDFRRDGFVSAVIEVFDRDDETVLDLLAWPVDRPEHFATMFGTAAVLGSARIESRATYHLDRPLRVFRTPLSWLQAGGAGVVLIDKAAGAAALADALGPIAGEDVQHARELARLARHFVDPRRVVAPLPEAA